MTAEVIEGEAREIDAVALTVRPDHGMTAAGPLALASLTDEEFDRRLAALDTMRTRVARMQKALMVKDVDYGVIPGTGTKPTLLKPGAEKLCQAYGLAAEFVPQRIVGDGDKEPHLSYLMRCELHLGSTAGLIVAVGYGSANSFEAKHRYRRAARICPNCGKPAIIKGKAEYGGGWVCFKKKDGCGSKWRDGAPEIEGQSVEDIENPDPFDLDVVLVKMSEKRAFIDATLRATAASGLFTQDVEDLPREPVQEPPRDHDSDGAAASQTTHRDGLLGKAIAQGTQDFELRQHETKGFTLPFRLKEGRLNQIVLAQGELALQLADTKEQTLDQRITVWGHFEDDTFPKRDGSTVTYKVLHAERVKVPDGRVLPVTPEAPKQNPSGIGGHEDWDPTPPLPYSEDELVDPPVAPGQESFDLAASQALDAEEAKAAG